MEDFLAFYDKVDKTKVFKMFGFEHLVVISIICVLINITMFVVARIKKEKAIRIIKVFGIIVPCLELCFTAWMYMCGVHNIINLLPLHICALQMFFVPLSVFMKNDVLRDYVYLTAIVGGIFGIVFPSGIANYYPIISFRAIETFLFHYLILIIPILMIRIKEHRPNIKNYVNVMIVVMLLVDFTFIIDTAFGQNYMFLREGAEVGFIEKVYGISPMLYLVSYISFLFVGALIMYLPFTLKFKRRKEDIKD